MCDFCKSIGLFGEENLTKPIEVESIDVGNLCDLLQLEAWLVTNNDGTNPKINLSLVTRGPTNIAELTIPIQYCPICGKKLVD